MLKKNIIGLPLKFLDNINIITQPNLKQRLIFDFLNLNTTVCPRNTDPFSIVSYHMKWVTIWVRDSFRINYVVKGPC